MQWPATRVPPRAACSHTGRPRPFLGFVPKRDGLFLSLVFFEVSSLSALGLM